MWQWILDKLAAFAFGGETEGERERREAEEDDEDDEEDEDDEDFAV